MNIAQRIVIGLGVIALALVVFVWPVTYTVPTTSKSIFARPEARTAAAPTATRALAVIAVTGGLTLILANKKEVMKK